MTVFFTSDIHAYHKNILKYNPYSRKGKDENEMTEMILENLSSIKPNDVLYNLGDFSFGSYLQTEYLLTKIKKMGFQHHLVYGNHDQTIKKTPYFQEFFDSVQEKKFIKIGGRHIVLNHFPEAVWDRGHYGSYMLHGHCHGGYTGVGRIMDVGIDTRPNGDMNMWSFEEIDSIMSVIEYRKHH